MDNTDLTTDPIAQWYSAVVEKCHLDPTTFQLMQGNLILNYTSETLWNIFDVIPPKSLNHFYNPAQINLFSDNYGAIIQNLKPGNPIVSEAVQTWADAGGAIGIKAFNKTIKDLKQELQASSGITFSMNITSESPKLSQTWASGNIESSPISLFEGDQIENADTIINVEFKKLITFVSAPLSKQSTLNPDLHKYKPWYNSAALQLAYHEKEIWSQPQSWNTFFGQQGSNLRCCVSLVVVDGVTIETNSTNKIVFWPYPLQFNTDSKKPTKTVNRQTVKMESPLGNPLILGVNVLTVPRFLGISTTPITESSKISKELEEILNSMNVIRKIAIAIANNTEKKLINPKYYLEDGEIKRTDLTIYEKEVGFVASRKTEYSVFGSWGVVTYEIENTNKKLAIMWSVPFDYVLYENWFKLAIINLNNQTDKNLLDDMYYNKGMTKGKVKKAATGSETWQQEGYILQGIMGTGGSATLNMSINSI
ncbi:hypothetical protein LC653_26400 [Nostoc sp. CHAB 5784]|uniref:hypothetical protein n=1 Tax=Nostoc mirabile TaxID=2907820 RepID=UPI001E454E6F|nr:hypothetical protein [Nostoc mirabile]MCC5667317.1 hypothetical protein [Nostoc mirabile CHAB5784]